MAAVVGGFVGMLVIGGTVLFIICFCHYQRKHKSNNIFISFLCSYCTIVCFVYRNETKKERA